MGSLVRDHPLPVDDIAAAAAPVAPPFSGQKPAALLKTAGFQTRNIAVDRNQPERSSQRILFQNSDDPAAAAADPENSDLLLVHRSITPSLRL